MNIRSNRNYGISSIGICLPKHAMSLMELAKLRGVDPNKYTIGLGCETMAISLEKNGIVNLAVRAAQRAIANWNGDPSSIGLISVGTETPVDFSRPLSAWVADELAIKGAVRSYEVKHACLGGTLAIKQAVEWLCSGANHNKVALVIAVDIALYSEGDPGEPTQGAGAVALIIGYPNIAAIDINSLAWSEPAFDFWKPLGEKYPRVDGPYSLDCYKNAAEHCFTALINDADPKTVLSQIQALCFHVPFPKMVKKAVFHIGEKLGISESDINQLYIEKVEPYMAWNKLAGNLYTGSLWLAVANALQYLKETQRITAFSYGSGFGSELLLLTAGPVARRAPWVNDINKDLNNRNMLTKEEYQQYRMKLT